MDVLPQKHDTLWFPDGSIVLATDSLLFRVHKGVLSFHSTVLRDMFDLVRDPTAIQRVVDSSNSTEGSTEATGNADMYEGLPLVILPGEKGKGVAHLLRSIYDRR